jgi:hypothetical protein
LCLRIDGRRIIQVVHDVGKTFDNRIEWVNFDGVSNRTATFKKITNRVAQVS